MKDSSIVIEKVVKPTESYTSLCVFRPGSDVARAVRLEGCYEQLCCGKDPDTLMRELAEESLSCAVPFPCDISWIDDYDEVRNRLFIRLSSVGSLERIGSIAPVRMEGDMVMTCHILINRENSCFASTLVTKKYLAGYGISAEKLFEDACANSPLILPVKMEALEAILMGSAAGNDESGEAGLMVLTNETGTDGASALFYPGEMKHAEEYFGGSYYILPSSVHELILMPEDFCPSTDCLNDMVARINAAVVRPEDRLSDIAYHYDASGGVFESLDEYRSRAALS